MVHVSILGMILLFSAVHLHASSPADSQKKEAEKPLLLKAPSLRALRAQMASGKKPTSLADVVVSAAHMAQVVAEPKKSLALLFSKTELDTRMIQITDEEAREHKISKTTSVASLIGKQIGGSICKAGKSMADADKITRLGYKDKGSFVRGEFVVVADKNRCFYGLIVCKKVDGSYQVQVGDSAVVSFEAGDIASK